MHRIRRWGTIDPNRRQDAIGSRAIISRRSACSRQQASCPSALSSLGWMGVHGAEGSHG